MTNTISRQKNNQRGFSILETIVAIAVLIVGITAPLVIAQRGLRVSQVAKEEITAFFLAQEAFEFVKTVRDTNSFDNDPWLQGLTTCESTNGCKIDATTNIVSPCSSGGCAPLLYDDTTAAYGYATGDESKFTRTIKITTFPGGTEAAVDVTVEWPNNLGTDSIVIRETIHDFLDAVVSGGGGGITPASDPFLFNHAQQTFTGSNTSVAWDHELLSANNRILLVFAAYEDSGGADDITSVRYTDGGSTNINLTKLQDARTSGGNSTFEIWYLDEADMPADGTYSIQVSFSGSVDGSFGSAMYSNVSGIDSSGIDGSPTPQGARTFSYNSIPSDSIIIEAFMGGEPGFNELALNGDQVLVMSEWGDTRPDLFVIHSFVSGSLNSDVWVDVPGGWVRSWIVLN